MPIFFFFSQFKWFELCVFRLTYAAYITRCPWLYSRRKGPRRWFVPHLNSGSFLCRYPPHQINENKKGYNHSVEFFHLGYPLGLRAATGVRKGITYQMLFRSSGISPRQRNTHLIGQPFCSALY